MPAVTPFHRIADELEKLVDELRENADKVALGQLETPEKPPEPAQAEAKAETAAEKAEHEPEKAAGVVKKGT